MAARVAAPVGGPGSGSDELGEVVGGCRAAEVPALAGVAAGGVHAVGLVGGFDAFGGDGEVEGAGEVDGGGEEVLVVVGTGVWWAGGEGAVEFEGVGGEAAEGCQVAVADAEVVQG